MKKFTTLTLGALSLTALTAACNMEVGDVPAEEVGTTQDAVACNNDQATNGVMAKMAVAAGNDIHRWLPQRDMQKVTVTVTPPPPAQPYTYQKIALSQYAYPRCLGDGRHCYEINRWLGLQDESPVGAALEPMQFSGVTLDRGSLRSRMIAAFDAQMTCINRPDNHTGDDCPVEIHEILPTSTVVSSQTCNGGSDHWFHATKAYPNQSQLLQYPGQLKNMLLWAGYPNNPYLQFDVQGDDVKIDPPFDGTGSGGGTGSGSCEVANNPVPVAAPALFRCDTTDVVKPAGTCCTCGGLTKQWRPAASPGFYACKT